MLGDPWPPPALMNREEGPSVNRQNLKIVKDICVVVPTVALTASAVLGIAVVLGLSSWAVL